MMNCLQIVPVRSGHSRDVHATENTIEYILLSADEWLPSLSSHRVISERSSLGMRDKKDDIIPARFTELKSQLSGIRTAVNKNTSSPPYPLDHLQEKTRVKRL